MLDGQRAERIDEKPGHEGQSQIEMGAAIEMVEGHMDLLPLNGAEKEGEESDAADEADGAPAAGRLEFPPQPEAGGCPEEHRGDY